MLNKYEVEILISGLNDLEISRKRLNGLNLSTAIITDPNGKDHLIFLDNAKAPLKGKNRVQLNELYFNIFGEGMTCKPKSHECLAKKPKAAFPNVTFITLASIDQVINESNITDMTLMYDILTWMYEV